MTGSTIRVTNNKDLIWGLDHLKRFQVATDFVQRFENRLCVFSPSVQQLYSNYSIFIPDKQRSSIVVLPDPYAFQDTFNHIPADAVQATGLHILPGEVIDREGLQLVMLQNGRTRSNAPVGFKQGFRNLLKHFKEQDPFLPVLLKGDLREFNASIPCLHLHRLRLPLLSGLSGLEQQFIKRVITKKMMSLYNDSEMLQG